MFESVEAYHAFIVRCLRATGEECEGAKSCEIAAFAAKSFACVTTGCGDSGCNRWFTGCVSAVGGGSGIRGLRSVDEGLGSVSEGSTESDGGVAGAGSCARGGSPGSVVPAQSGLASGDIGVDESVDCVSAKTLANREKRRVRAERKKRRKEQQVPEWRRKDARALVHKGVFAECSDAVQRDLRESRAKMLIAKNEVAVVEAEHRRRTVEARLKARVVEEEVERKRLDLVDANRRLVEAQMASRPSGFAETVVSLGLESVVGTPSLSSGSVSPDSSISVAELRRKDAAIEMLVAKVAELTAAAGDRGMVKETVNDVYVSDGYAKEEDNSCFEVVTGRQSGARSVGRKRMSSTERAKRNYLCLPVEGPGSGMDGHCRWD